MLVQLSWAQFEVFKKLFLVNWDSCLILVTLSFYLQLVFKLSEHGSVFLTSQLWSRNKSTGVSASLDTGAEEMFSVSWTPVKSLLHPRGSTRELDWCTMMICFHRPPSESELYFSSITKLVIELDWSMGKVGPDPRVEITGRWTFVSMQESKVHRCKMAKSRIGCRNSSEVTVHL